MKIKKKDQKLIDFFKLVGVYDEKAFKYIYNHKVDIKNKSEAIYLDYLKDNRLIGFTINAPVIKNNEDMLKSIYLFAKAMNLYKKINKVYNEEITDEILPLSLVKIYTKIYLKDDIKTKISDYEYNKLIKCNDVSYLLAYDLQYGIANDFLKTGILLIPDSFYVDDVEKLKKSCFLK